MGVAEPPRGALRARGLDEQVSYLRALFEQSTVGLGVFDTSLRYVGSIRRLRR